MRTVRVVFWVIMGCSLVALLLTVIRSGYWYQLDNDEYYHSQLVYLMNHGQQIYSSFYTFYSPLFYWLLQPVFHIVGYTIEILYVSRIVMIVLFLLRLFILFLLIGSVFSWKSALFASFFLLLDPFTVMTGMQIRPDSLMLLLFTVALFLYARARKREQAWFYFASGVFLALSLFSLIKIIPSVVVFLLVVFISAVMRKRLTREGMLFLGFALTLSLLCAITMALGIFPQMIQQTIIDPLTVFTLFLYPVPYGFFLREGNMWIYGPESRSLSWVFAQLFLPLAGIGMYGAFELVKKRETSVFARDILLILLGSMIGQWLWLITVPSIFLQYYLPIHWIVASLGGIAVASLFEGRSSQRSSIIWHSVACGIVLLFVYGGIQTNVFRSGIRSTDAFHRIRSMWITVPKNEAVFPSILFRPIVYPPTPYYTIYPGELSSEVLGRYPSVRQVLEEKNVRYVYNHTTVLSSLSQEDQAYIRLWYVPSKIDDEIFIRKR